MPPDGRFAFVPLPAPALSAPIPTTVPASFAAGETVKYRRNFPGYPASAGWTYANYVRGAASLDVGGGMVAADGDDFVVTIPASGTPSSNIAAGTYTYAERLTKAGEVYPGASGTLVITPNVATADAGALQSHAERMVPLLESALERRVAADMVSYTLLNRSLTREELATYRALLAQYRLEVQAQRNGGRLPPYRTVFSRA